MAAPLPPGVYPPPLFQARHKDDYGKILKLSESQLLKGQENYTSWAIYMKAVLYEARCLSHVLPPTDIPREARPPPSRAVDKIQWDNRDQAGIVAITSNIHQSQHSYVMGHDSTAATLWDFLLPCIKSKMVSKKVLP